MKLHELRPNEGAFQTKKRVGRGPGSGLGKTSGRGQKGQKARSGASINPVFEGGQLPLYRRIPRKGFNNAKFRTVYGTINVEELNKFEDGTTVTPALLKDTGLLKKQYDVIYGSWPNSYDEVVLVVDENNELDDMTLYALGLETKEAAGKIIKASMNQEEVEFENKSWSYEEICSSEYRTILNSECYSYDENTGLYTDLRETDTGLKYLYDNATVLKVTGIIRPKEDAVASMLYLDYGRDDGHWIANKDGGNKNYEAVEFLQELNEAVFKDFPDVCMIAEESTAWPLVSKPVYAGGLGFNFKWNMGWSNDMFEYVQCDPFFRKSIHDKLTFSFCYAFTENYILPVSHDEVVHGKKSFLDRMSGDYWQKFAGARAFMGYMMTHPGKKLNFMGSEIGQFREWDYEGEIEWFLLEYESHAKFQRYVAELNHFYLSQPALWQIEGSWDGFKWIDPDDNERSIISYRRIDKKGKELLVLINFTPVVYEHFLLGTDVSGTYEEIFNSDDVRFGGSGVVNFCPIQTTGIGMNGCGDSIRVKLPPLSIVILRKK